MTKYKSTANACDARVTLDENGKLALAIMRALEEIRSELPQAWLGGRQRFLLFKSLRKHLALQFGE